MRPLPLLSVVLAMLAFTSYAQSPTPPGINYQGVARNIDGKPLVLKDIALRVSIVKNGDTGEVEYAETHAIKTNSFGLFTLVIGSGNSVQGDFRFVSWAMGNKWLRVEMDPDGGNAFKLMGSQQFMSVPYAFYAQYSGNGGNPPTAGQGISISNNVISNTGDADNNSTNELNTSLELTTQNKLRLTDAGGVKEVDLSPLSKNQTLDGVLTLGNDAGNRIIKNLATPVTGGDAATKGYVDALDNTLKTYVDARDVTTKAYVDSKVVDLVAKTYVDAADASAKTYVDAKTTDMATKTYVDAGDLANKTYVDTKDATQKTYIDTNDASVRAYVDSKDATQKTYIDATDASVRTYVDTKTTDMATKTYVDAGDLANKNYVDAKDATQKTYIDTNDASVKSYVDTKDATQKTYIDAKDATMKTYVDTRTSNTTLTVAGNNRTLNENGNILTFSVADDDNSITNEIQNLNQVLIQSNDAGNQKITNLATPTANTDAVTKKYVDDADNVLATKIATTYAFKTDFAFTNSLGIPLTTNNVAIPFTTETFDDFSVLAGSSFTAAENGTYVFIADGVYNAILAGGQISMLVNGIKYPITIMQPWGGTGGRFNATMMFRLTAGQTVSLVGDNILLNGGFSGSFYGYKL